jgi:hypothetical protein
VQKNLTGDNLVSLIYLIKMPATASPGSSPSGGGSPGVGSGTRTGAGTPGPADAEVGRGGGDEARRKGLEKEARKKAEKQRFDNKLKEVKEQVKSPEEKDEEGKLLRQAFTEAITTEKGKGANSSVVRDMNETYRRAKKSRDNLDRAGEADKLVASVDALYHQAGFTDYKFGVEIKHEELPEGEDAQKKFKADALRKKLEEEFDGFLDKTIDRMMTPYYERKTKLELATENTLEAVSKENVSRSEVNRAIHSQEAAENSTASVGERTLIKLGRKDRITELDRRRTMRRYAYLEEPFTRLDEMEAQGKKEERDELIEAKVQDYRKHLEEKSPHAAESFDHLRRNREDLVTGLLNTELEINNTRENLKSSVRSGDAERVCEWTAKLKDLELERGAHESKMEVALAGQRRRDSIRKVRESWKELGESFANIKGGKAEAARNLLAAGKEVVNAHTGYAKKWVKKALSPALRKLEQGKQLVGQAFAEMRNGLDDVVEEAVETSTAVYETGVTENLESARAKAERVKSEAKRHKVDVDRWYYKKKHKMKTGGMVRMAKLASTTDAGKKHIELGIGQLIQAPFLDEEQKRRLRRRHGGIESARVLEAHDKELEIREKRANNPDLDTMIDRLANKVVREVAPEEPEAAESEVSPAPEGEVDAGGPVEAGEKREKGEEKSEELKKLEEALAMVQREREAVGKKFYSGEKLTDADRKKYEARHLELGDDEHLLMDGIRAIKGEGAATEKAEVTPTEGEEKEEEGGGAAKVTETESGQPGEGQKKEEGEEDSRVKKLETRIGDLEAELEKLKAAAEEGELSEEEERRKNLLELLLEALKGALVGLLGVVKGDGE